jgi:stage IV sporulation protein B
LKQIGGKEELAFLGTVVNMKQKPLLFLRVLALFLVCTLALPALALPIAADGIVPTLAPLSFDRTNAQESIAVPCAVRGRLSSLSLIVGGMPFGLRMQTKGVLVVGVGEVKCGTKTYTPAKDAGLRARDVITEIDGNTVSDVTAVTARIGACGGNKLTFTVLREGKVLTLTVNPVRAEDGKWAAGLLIRDSASGIGTVTFLDPDTGVFGGLGHGVCDGESGALIPISRGTVLSVRVSGVVKGERGKPGELRGAFSGSRLGSLTENSECGVFGVLTTIPEGLGDPVPVAEAGEVREGKASIRCTLGDDGIGEYEIEITHIDRSARPTKSFTIRITDARLLSRTGGIVQGMSGSPIIQNGKLVGAVTHVLVDDPTSGYGIFLENMLTRMQLRVAA